jgi:hypothetical protein
MKFTLLEGGHSMGINTNAFDFLEKKGFNIKHGHNRNYFQGESFYENVTITINNLKEMEKLLLLSNNIHLAVHKQEKKNILIIREYIDEESI